MKLFTPVVLILAGIGVFFMFTDPQYKEVQVLKANSQQYTDVLQKSKDLLRIRDDLDKKHKSFEAEDLARLQKMLPDTVDNVRLIIDIDRVAARYGLALKGIRLDDSSLAAQNLGTKTGAQGAVSAAAPSTSSNFGSVTMGFSVAADYDTFLRFLRDLEESLRLVDVTDISLKPDSRGLYSYTLTLKTYWLK